jgi:hypothetical protein
MIKNFCDHCGMECEESYRIEYHSGKVWNDGQKHYTPSDFIVYRVQNHEEKYMLCATCIVERLKIYAEKEMERWNKSSASKSET